jgi:hypothetical protein
MHSKEEEQLQALKFGWSVCKTSLKNKVNKEDFFKPAQNEPVGSCWPTKSRWMNCSPSK